MKLFQKDIYTFNGWETLTIHNHIKTPELCAIPEGPQLENA
jgi:hypothetical protein